MGVKFGQKNRIYPQREPKKQARQVLQDTAPVIRQCKLSDKDICMFCLEHAQEVNLVRVKEHFRCPVCSYKCSCTDK